MAQKLHFGRDDQGFNALAPQDSENRYSATLASLGNATVTVPSTAESFIVTFSATPGASIWVSFGGTAAQPAGGTFAVTTSMLNPGSRSVPKGVVIDVLNSGTTTIAVGIEFYEER